MSEFNALQMHFVITAIVGAILGSLVTVLSSAPIKVVLNYSHPHSAIAKLTKKRNCVLSNNVLIVF